MAAARDERAQISNEARVEAQRAREETTAARRRHTEDVARLQQVANEHGARLWQHLADMLDQVDSVARGSGQ